MAEEEQVGIQVDMSRVVERLKVQWGGKLAELEVKVAMLEVALESTANERNQAEEDNRRLRAESMKPLKE